MTKLHKQLQWYQAFVDIVTVYGENEVGGTEPDTEAIIEYLDSDKFFVDVYNIKTKEEMYERITNEVLNGFPIWRLLKLSDFARNMFERDFKTYCDNKDEIAKKTYKCYHCKYYMCRETSFGTVIKCNKTRLGGDDFEYKKKCKYFDAIE